METITTFREAQECVIPYTGNRCWLFVRLLAAMILLVAAGLKGHQLLTVPLLGEGLLYARWFNVLVVESEVFLGIWLVFGVLPRVISSACRECVEQYANLASEFSTGEGCPKIAIIEVPPFEITAEKHGNNVIYGQLDGRKKWKVKMPVSLLVDNGKVQSIFENPLDVALIRSIWEAERR